MSVTTIATRESTKILDLKPGQVTIGTDLTVVCIWSVIGLVLTAFMLSSAFDPSLAQSLVMAG